MSNIYMNQETADYCLKLELDNKRLRLLVRSLQEALEVAIAEADGWHDDSRGGPVLEVLDAGRELLDSMENI